MCHVEVFWIFDGAVTPVFEKWVKCQSIMVELLNELKKGHWDASAVSEYAGVAKWRSKKFMVRGDVAHIR